jgi:N-formylmaleamate deformylase
VPRPNLAGFAREPRIEAPFLETVRKDLAVYIRKNKLDKPVIVGHSLGGFMALWLAAREPDLVGPLVIVDSLPFLAGVMQPDATADSVKPMAENMRKRFRGPPTAETEKTAESSSRRWSPSPKISK